MTQFLVPTFDHKFNTMHTADKNTEIRDLVKERYGAVACHGTVSQPEAEEVTGKNSLGM